MIRINLLGVERKQVRKAPTFDIGQRLTVACSLILVVGLLGIGWWYWTLSEASTRVDRDIAAAQVEAARLRSLLTEVQQFEARRGQLQQRVQLIEQLRGGQSVPVQLLDHVSRSLPDMLWLTSMTQTGPAVTIEGRSTTLIALSDFVGNLGNNGKLLQKPIEIVNSEVENVAVSATSRGQAPVETIRFTVRAQLAGVAAPNPARAGGPGARGRGAAPATK
jgi:type IV pilus assembly protein PilN